MMESGDWLSPTQDGVPRLQKPPLVYWCEVLSMSVLGVNEFGARFPAALATVGWFLATGLLARRVVGTWSAGLAGDCRHGVNDPNSTELNVLLMVGN